MWSKKPPEPSLKPRKNFMPGLSTSCCSATAADGDALVAALEQFDISTVELDYRISPAVFGRMRSRLKKSRLNVISVHNYFPVPPDSPTPAGGGDVFSLASCDRGQRNRAIKWTQETIRRAGGLGASAVVLHCGYVEMEPELPRLYRLLAAGGIGSPPLRALLADKLKERDARRAKHLDCLVDSLEKLAPVAEKHGIYLGLENRYHYHELPTLADFETIFDRLPEAPLGYWHDTGHAHAAEQLGLAAAADWLQHYHHRLIGIHLHDAVGLQDHLPPGSGEVNFAAVEPYLSSDTLQIIELKPGTAWPAVARGIETIRRLWLADLVLDK